MGNKVDVSKCLVELITDIAHSLDPIRLDICVNMR